MKCIKCGTDNNLRDRIAHQSRCKNCGHSFVFDPKFMEKSLGFTDKFFDRAIFDLSAKGTLFFTSTQFYYFLDRRLKNRVSSFGSIGGWCLYLFIGFWFTAAFQDNPLILIAGSLIFNTCLILVFFFRSGKQNKSYYHRLRFATDLIILGVLIIFSGFIFIENGYLSFLTILFFGLVSIYLGQKQRAKLKHDPDFLVAREKFEKWLDRWTNINQEITELLPSPIEESSESEVNPELGNYSFDRVVVCDTSSIAQMLIANNFHFEHNCAILSITGYPQSVFKPVMEMLRRNPDLKVYAFHNASPKGVGLVHHLQTRQNWFAENNATIYDLGLLPRQILKNRNRFIRNSAESGNEAKEIPAAVRQSLSADEIAWLEKGNFVELESFGPKKLMQVLSQGMAMSREADIDEESSLVSIDVYDSDSDVFMISSDTFG